MWLILTENVDTNSNKYQNFWHKMWLGIKVIHISSPEQKHSPLSTQLLLMFPFLCTSLIYWHNMFEKKSFNCPLRLENRLMSAKTSESIDSPTSWFHQLGGGGIAALIITLCHRNRNEITQLCESISKFTFKLYSFHTTCVLHRRDLQMRPSNRLERENEIFLGDQSLFITWVGWKREFWRVWGIKWFSWENGGRHQSSPRKYKEGDYRKLTAN